MSQPKFDGIKDDLDVIGIVKAFGDFKDGVQLMADRADEITVDLPFETSYNGKKHYTFHQDDNIAISGVSFHPDTKKLMFSVPEGANDKIFYLEEADIINVVTTDPTNGPERSTLADEVKNIFKKSFKPELKVNSLAALQAMTKNNPGLATYLNDSDAFLEKQDVVSQRGKAYATLTNFGKY